MPASINIYKLEQFPKNNLNFEEDVYTRDIGEIKEYDVKLKQKIYDFSEIETDLLFFHFKHETTNTITIGGKNVPLPLIHEAGIWILFKDNLSKYLFVNSKSESLTFVLREIKNLIHAENLKKEHMVELIITPVDMKEYYDKIVKNDLTTLTRTSIKDVSEKDANVTLTGDLIDNEGNESEQFGILNEKGDKTSMTLSSKNLGYHITISESKISSRDKNSNNESLITYFRDIILPLLDQ